MGGVHALSGGLNTGLWPIYPTTGILSIGLISSIALGSLLSYYQLVRILLLVFAVDVILSLSHFVQHTLGSSYELSFSGVWLQEFLFVGCHISLILGY